MFSPCSTCERHVHSHSLHLFCSCCYAKTHLNCIPHVQRNDPLYVNRQNSVWFCIQCVQTIFPFNYLEDDTDFISAVSDRSNDVLFDLDGLNSRIDNVIELGCIDDISPLRDSDPDNFFEDFNATNLAKTCSYYNEDTFQKRCSEVKDISQYLSLMHVNIRSVQQNFKNLEEYIESLNYKFDVTGLSETWLNENTHANFNPEGYSVESIYRSHKSGGGVSLLVKDNLQYVRRDDLTVNTEHLECLFVELSSSCGKNKFNKSTKVLVGTVYRPPNTSIERFLESLSPLLDVLKREAKISYIMGDFNINLMNVDTHIQSSEFLELMFAYSFVPLIYKPTRVTHNTATLIDNIFKTYKPNSRGIQGICCTDVSDHLPIFYIDQSMQTKHNADISYKRHYTPKNLRKFQQILSDVDWHTVCESDDAQRSFSDFNDFIQNKYNDCFPVKKNNSSYKNKCQWLTPGLIKSIKIKNKLYIQNLKFPSWSNNKQYKDYKKTLRTVMRKCERNFYDKQFAMNKDNMKKCWRLIKSVINKNNYKSKIDSIFIEGRLVVDNLQIANRFNNYFLNIGKNLSKTIPNTHENYTAFMKTPNFQSIVIAETNESEVFNVINKFKNTSPGWDDLAANIIKQSSEYLVQPLVKLLNLSLSQGIVPTECKIAKVIPLYKSGDKTAMNNYRPVSILPLFSKIYERVMYNRLINFFEKNNTLFDNQFGFRKNYNTSLALSYLINTIIKAHEQQDVVLGLFLDYSKAFDTVNHDILLRKLDYYGVRGTALKWIKNYLTNRTQYVSLNGVNSQCGKITCGVPQGSILGPLLFLVYVNDIAHVSNICKPVMYADDTSMFMSGKDTNVLVKNMNEELCKLVRWLNINRLSLNIEKTHYIVFNPGRRTLSETDDLSINGIKLKRKNSTLFLGVKLDDKLSWKDHVQHIKLKIAKNIGILRKCREKFQRSTLISLYYCFIYPFLSYCIEVWGSVAKVYLNSIVKVQKICCRMICFSSRRSPSAPLFKLLNVLCMSNIYKYSILLLMYRFYYKQLPHIASSIFKMSVNSMQTRNVHFLFVPLMKSQKGLNSLIYQGPYLWNSYCAKLDYHCSLKTFKMRVHNHLINEQM